MMKANMNMKSLKRAALLLACCATLLAGCETSETEQPKAHTPLPMEGPTGSPGPGNPLGEGTGPGMTPTH